VKNQNFITLQLPQDYEVRLNNGRITAGRRR